MDCEKEILSAIKRISDELRLIHWVLNESRDKGEVISHDSHHAVSDGTNSLRRTLEEISVRMSENSK